MLRRFNPFRPRHGLCALGLLAFCAGAAAQAPPREVSPADLGKYWLVTNSSVWTDVPHNGKGLDKPTCAALRYVINGDGTTSDIVLEKLVPDSALGSVAVSFVSGLRYAPGPSNKALNPVSTRLVLPLNLPLLKGNDAERAQIQAQRDAVVAACAPARHAVPAVQGEGAGEGGKPAGSGL